MDSPPTKTDFAYAEIRNRIISGELPGGVAIPQASLAADLGLSTTPLREAVRRLTAEGLIELSAHRDARVVALTATEASHLYEVRQAVDPLATRLAAERRTSQDLAAIHSTLAALSPITRHDDVEALLRHRAFHRAIYVASANPVLVEVLDRLWDKADRYRVVGLESRPDSTQDTRRVQVEHLAIAHAITAGDARAAEAAMREHISGSLGRRAIQALGGDA